jgi:hypothetical protein
MSTEAVRELGLEVGSLATAVVKATMVIVETPPVVERKPGTATATKGGRR